MMDYLLGILREFLSVLAAMSPWLLLGFAVAGLLHVLIPGAFVLKHLSGRGFSSVLKASLLGVPLPLCSCGVIPVAASLRSRGASPGATASFLISTPQTGIDSILVTYSLLGPIFAVFRVLAAFVSGLLGGALVDLTSSPEAASDALSETTSNSQAAPAWRRAVKHGFITLPGDLAKSLSLGLLIAALITVLLPTNLLGSIPGGNIATMLAVMALGLPIYVCATASIPIAAALMLSQGVSPGAALVFLMTGPATNAATVLTIKKMMGFRAVLVYLAVVMVTALAAGLSLDALSSVYDLENFSHGSHAGMSGVSTVELVSAILLAILLLRAPIEKLWRKAKAACEASKIANTLAIELKIVGMSCKNCAESVRSALEADEQVISAEVDAASGIARLVLKGLPDQGGHDCDACESDETDELTEKFANIVRAAGYQCDGAADS